MSSECNHDIGLDDGDFPLEKSSLGGIRLVDIDQNN